MSSDDRLRTLFSDLGKATLRGIKKCPKCGTYNGSRGLCCKNKYCDAIFKEPGERRKVSTEACKLITGTTAQVFSVRIRDKGPDYRGFVQLPLVSDATTVISQTTALCFVDSCERSFDTSILKSHDKDLSDSTTIPTCQHIQAALRCYAEGQPLTLKNSILSSLNVNNEMKQEIWLLATETLGPLVQRISKNIMAVKCKVSSKHPLGYLHFSFYTTKFKDKIEHRYCCNCDAFQLQARNRCAHFYACICAFASDAKLSEEFDYYINLDEKESKNTDTLCNTRLLIFHDDSQAVQSVDMNCINLDTAIFTGNIVDEINVDCQQSILDDNIIISQLQDTEISASTTIINAQELKILNDQSAMDTDINLTADYLFSDNVTVEGLVEVRLVDDCESGTLQCSSKRKRDENLSVPINSLNNLNSIETRKGKTRPSIVKKQPNLCASLDETNTNLPFIKWLASITERINQTMHFQFNGKPEPLVFHVPQIFFDCLRERISCGGKKKRLPNSTTAFIRKDGVPLGTFTKYTWQITNILHVKSIFDTPLIPLEITRSFIQNSDGTYDLYKREETEIDKYKKTGNSPLIKPLELKTYLKVGNTCPDQVEPTPFLIEWIPDILPISKIGELRIRFEFGHVKKSTPDKWRKIALSRNS